MLIGSYSGVLSDKRRVAVPRKYLDELGERLIVAKWYENCLVLVSNDYWDELFKRLTGGGRAKTYAIRDNERFILGSAFEITPDDQGRVVLPDSLVKFSNIDRDVVFVGLRDRVEIWSKERWERKENELPESARAQIEQL